MRERERERWRIQTSIYVKNRSYGKHVSLYMSSSVLKTIQRSLEAYIGEEGRRENGEWWGWKRERERGF